MDQRSVKIHTAADYIAKRIEGRKPVAGIVLGSGLGKLADNIEDKIIIPYKDIPEFPQSTAVGHKGNFICGTLGGGIGHYLSLYSFLLPFTFFSP